MNVPRVVISQLLFCFLASAICLPAHAEKPVPVETPTAAEEADAEGAPADSTGAFPKKRRSRSTAEILGSLPGFVAYAPFWILFQTAGAVIAVNEEYLLFPKIKELLISADGKRGIVPIYTARSGGGATLFVKDKLNDGSRFNATAAWGIRNRQLYQLRYRNIDLFGGALTSAYNVQFRQMPDERFSGVGPGVASISETNFAHKQPLASLSLGKEFGKRLMADVLVGIEHNIIDDGADKRRVSTNDIFTEQTLPGIEDEVTMSRVEIGLSYDGKNRAFRPSKGVEASVRGGFVQETSDDVFGFSTVTADVQTFIHLFRDRILVLRIGAEFKDPLSDRTIPFYYLSELGSVSTIRGFKRGRFRDNDMVLGSVEYRYPIWRTIDALFFVDAGQVAGGIFEDFDTNDLEFTFGGGFRAWSREGTFMRIEVGKSDDGFRLHFILN